MLDSAWTHKRVVGQFCFTVVPEEWKENFRMPSQRIRGVLVWTVGNAMKTVVWIDADQLMRSR